MLASVQPPVQVHSKGVPAIFLTGVLLILHWHWFHSPVPGVHGAANSCNCYMFKVSPGDLRLWNDVWSVRLFRHTVCANTH